MAIKLSEVTKIDTTSIENATTQAKEVVDIASNAIEQTALTVTNACTHEYGKTAGAIVNATERRILDILYRAYRDINAFIDVSVQDKKTFISNLKGE